MKKKIAFFVMAAAIAVNGYSQEEGEKKGFFDDMNQGPFFEFGLGTSLGFTPNGINYNPVLRGIKETSEDAGEYGFIINIDAAVGWAVLENLYVVGALFGMGDLLIKDGNITLIGFRVYGAGVRFYPKKTPRLQLGLDVGAAETFVTSSIYQNVKNDIGFGTKITAAYDFDITKVGPSAAMGGGLVANFVDGEIAAAFCIFVKFLYK